jgi:hypothetical protein
MKITFICGSLNPGQDGVGDYTHRLADQLVLDGHECQLMSINDVVDAEETTNGTQIIRFKQLLSTPEKSQQAQQLIAQWQPEWISLQFVCFSFHPKGFIHRLTPFIQHCVSPAKLHIMFHELWVGEQPSLPFKHKVMGGIQRQLMLKALKGWQASAMHTSNALYQFVLSHHGYTASILPLFGNIPINSENDPNVALSSDSKQRTLLFPFSQRHDWNVTETMERFRDLAHATGVQLKLIQAGQINSDSPHWSTIQEFCKTHEWECELLGPQSEQSISKLMHDADIGVSSAHIALAGKSGAVAAMQEHGLPVICTITDPISRRFKPDLNQMDELYSLFDDTTRLEHLFSAPKRSAPKARLSSVAKQLIERLSTSTT